MSTNVEKVYKYAAELHDRRYPFALNLLHMPQTLGWIFQGFSERNSDYTPGYAVIEQMIPWGISNEPELSDKDTLQGYVNVVGLYAGVGQAKALNTPIFYESVYHFFQHWENLPEETRTSFHTFLYENDERVLLGSFNEKDLVDGRSFMAKLVKEMEKGNGSQLYLRGAKTARDTFSLYVELCQEFLKGKFRK